MYICIIGYYEKLININIRRGRIRMRDGVSIDIILNMIFILLCMEFVDIYV